MKIINRLASNRFAFLCIIFCMASVYSSCGSNDDEINPDGEVINPSKDVPDPTGTITLSMRDYKNGDTRLDGIYIDNENFTGNGFLFASIGPVKGLGNVANIPTTGWASKVAVIPGNGYVAYDKFGGQKKYYRIYVTDYIVSTTGGIIGAEIKYQVPFKGKDEAISLDVQSLTIPAEGSWQTLTFKNQGVILFDVKSDKFTVEKSSTYDYSFLTNGIAITAEPNSSSSAIEGTITLTTLYGKETFIKVTQAGAEPFVSFDKRELELSAAQQTQTVGMSSNIAFSDLSASSSASWCKAELVNNTSSMQTQSKKVKFIGDQPVNTTKAAQSDATISYSLKLSLEENSTIKPRNATITVKSKDGKTSATLKVVQKVANASFGQEQIELSAANQTKQVNFTSDLDISKLRVKSSTDWCKVDFGTSKNSIQFECEENPSKNSRNATIILQSVTGETIAQLEVVQKAANVSFREEQIELPATNQTKQVYFTSDIAISKFKVKSSANWCKVDFGTSGNSIQIECDENLSKNSRNATITLQSATGENLTQLKVVQKECTLTVNKTNFGLDKEAHYFTIDIITTASIWEVESSASWCTFSKNGNQLTIRVTASTEDRIAVVSFKGFDTKITVHQSKYAVGDNYNESGIEGTVGYIGDDVRYICKKVGETVWSTEYVETGANSHDDGEYNMNIIKKIPYWEDNYPPFLLCKQLNTNGVSGWYLPAMNEAYLLSRGLLSHSRNVWSSTEVNREKANGMYSSNYKSSNLPVYAVHKF